MIETDNLIGGAPERRLVTQQSLSSQEEVLEVARSAEARLAA